LTQWKSAQLAKNVHKRNWRKNVPKQSFLNGEREKEKEREKEREREREREIRQPVAIVGMSSRLHFFFFSANWSADIVRTFHQFYGHFATGFFREQYESAEICLEECFFSQSCATF
jgi:hypothetical protein